ncbi:MAG: YfjI family protein [Acidobacteriaceae bacterium]
MSKPRTIVDCYPPQSDPYADTTVDELARLVQDAPRILAGEDIYGGWSVPESLGTELPNVPAFDAGLLPEVLRPLVEDVSERMQTPLDFAAVVSVLSLAGVTGRRVRIQPKEADTTWTVVPNLWGGIVAEPGCLKSPLIAAVTKPLAMIEGLWRVEYESALASYKSEKEQQELREGAWKQLYTAAVKKGNELPLRPDDSIAQPQLRRLITQDATPEKLHEILHDNPAGVLVIRDELSGWFSTLEKQGREGEREFFLSAWNGDTGHTIDRIGRGSVHVPACCVSILGGIPPARLRSYLADVLKDGPGNDGLMQRFQLLTYPDSTGEWRYIDRLPNHKAIERVNEAYRTIAQMDSEYPLVLKFTPDAQALFQGWLRLLEARLCGDDLPSVMKAHLAKFRSLMPSLALLFSLADGLLQAVDLHHAQLAADWCGYLEAHANRIYASRINPAQLAAITLSRRLLTGWKRDEGHFALRDVYRSGWTGFGTPEESRAALLLLEEAAWIRREGQAPVPGRPSESFSINPRLKEATHAKH